MCRCRVVSHRTPNTAMPMPETAAAAAIAPTGARSARRATGAAKAERAQGRGDQRPARACAEHGEAAEDGAGALGGEDEPPRARAAQRGVGDNGSQDHEWGVDEQMEQPELDDDHPQPRS